MTLHYSSWPKKDEIWPDCNLLVSGSVVEEERDEPPLTRLAPSSCPILLDPERYIHPNTAALVAKRKVSPQEVCLTWSMENDVGRRRR